MNAMGCYHRLFYLRFRVLLFVAILRTTDGNSITWFEPPPVETISDVNVIRTVDRNLTKGFEEQLNWNFSLPSGSTLITVTLELASINRAVATYVTQTGSLSVTSGFQDQFNVTWIPSKITLTIFNVARDNEDVFICKVLSVGGSGLKTWERKIQVAVLVPSNITHISGNQTVNEGDDVNLNCTATGYPSRPISWRRLSDNTTVEMPLTNITRQENGCYRCTADNGVGSPATKDACIIVQYPPNITDISRNITVNDGDTVPLNCTADGFPTPNITWTRLSDNKTVPGTFNISGKQDEGYYRCTADNGIGNPATKKLFITVKEYRPTNTRLVTNLHNNIVNLTGSVNLTCSADANPLAKYRLYREENSLTNSTTGQDSFTYSTPVNERIKQVTFSCTPFNDYGDGLTKTINVTVHYPPLATRSGQNFTVSLNDSASFDCAVDGNPEPNITWYKGSTSGGTVLSLGKALNFSQTKLDDTGCYTCSASNSIGTDTITDCVKVELPPTPSTGKSSGPTSKVPDHSLEVTCKVTNYNCEDLPRENLTQKAQDIVEAQDCKVKRCKPGSAIVDLILRFNRSVDEGKVILDLKTAAENDEFGIFKVDPESIKITEPEPTTRGPPPCKNSFIEDENCKIKTTIVVVIAIVSVLVIVIVSGTTAWWVHRKRKCRKDRRTHSSECEEQLQQPEDNTYSQVNSGYAHSGPPSANGADGAGRQQAVPTYASVDKSKKKKKQQEEKPPEYATVDKSKKKKKDEKVDYTYAEVDMSKKSSKKEQPKNAEGLVYADLGDFQRPQMPPVSTSPAALPPVKRPQSYEGTQYADITEFLKGDAALPKKRNSQGMEMQPQAFAPANGSSQSNEVKPQGAPHSNGNSQGNEVKPQGANKDESGVPPKESKLQKAVDNTYSQVSSSYVHSGPPSGDGPDATARQQAAAAVPTHAADKTNKISKQKEDKSKEKKKKKKDEKEDCTYAELDKSKKAKKKQQPKDPKCLIYADLEDFSRPLIPPIPTSPKDLPPLKMPTAYEETPYADITEFRKGDAALPKEGNSQAMEMQPQGTSSANGNSQGNEVKPQGASPAKDNSQGDEMKPQGASPAIGNSQSSRDANEDESEMRPKESKL